MSLMVANEAVASSQRKGLSEDSPLGQDLMLVALSGSVAPFRTGLLQMLNNGYSVTHISDNVCVLCVGVPAFLVVSNNSALAVQCR